MAARKTIKKSALAQAGEDLSAASKDVGAALVCPSTRNRDALDLGQTREDSFGCQA
jgi:hypothetical protein